VNEEPKAAPAEEIVLKNAQWLRMKRFAMALTTYGFAIVATALTTRLGLGRMTDTQWLMFIGLALFANTAFFALFLTRSNLRFSDPSMTWAQIFCSGLWGMIALYALPQARPILLMFYMPAFSFGMLRLTREEYLRLVATVMGLYAGLLLLESFQGRQGFRIQYELFLFVLFGMLLTWFAFFGGFVTNIRRRLRLQNEEIRKAHEKTKLEMEERKRAQIEKDNLIVELQEALKKVRTLGGLIPICASCKKIRDDQGYWSQIESYIRTHSEAEFSHSICPECAKQLYPDLDIYEEDA